MSTTHPLPPDEAARCPLALPSPDSPPSVGILSRTLLNAPDLRVVAMHFAANEELTPHTSRHRVLVQVVQGACAFQVNDTWLRLETGELLHLPPDHPHAVRAEHGAFTLLLTFSLQPTSSHS